MSNSTKTSKQRAQCVEKCKNKGKDSQDMIRCCLCNVWFHCVCVGEDPTTTGVWNCDECRQTSSILHTLAQDVLSIKQYIGGIIRTVDIISDEINGLNKRIDDLTDEVKSLQSTNTQLVSELNEQHKIISDLKQLNTQLESKLARNAQDSENLSSGSISKRSLLIGSSIIRDVVSNDRDKLKVSSHSGATVSDNTRELSKENDSYEDIIIVVGGNDCDTEEKSPVSIKDDFVKLCSQAKQKCSHVKIASVLPRPKSRSNTSHLKSDQLDLIS